MATAADPPAAPDIIYLTSVEGQVLLEDAKKCTGGSLYQPILHAIFSKQVTRTGCGMQSCALLLSANRLGRRYSTQSFLALKPGSVDPTVIPYKELGMYSLPQTLAVTSPTAVETHGLTLSDVALVLESHGCSVRTVHASNSSPAAFRKDVIEALANADSRAGVIVNFSRRRLWPSSFASHHSPLAAYHAPTDRILILDTAVKWSDSWVFISDLFAAMNTIDRSANLSRGYCIAYK